MKHFGRCSHPSFHRPPLFAHYGMSWTPSLTSAFSLATATSLAAPLSLSSQAYAQSNIAIGSISGGILLLFVYAMLRTYARHYSVAGQRIRRCCHFLPGIVPSLPTIEEGQACPLPSAKADLSAIRSARPVSTSRMRSSYAPSQPVNVYRARIEAFRAPRRQDGAARPRPSSHRVLKAEAPRQVAFSTPQGSAFISPTAHASMYLEVQPRASNRTRMPKASHQSFASLASVSSYSASPPGLTRPRRAQLADKIKSRNLALQALNGS